MEEDERRSLILSQGSVAQIIIEKCRAKYISSVIVIKVNSIGLTRLKIECSNDVAPTERYLFNLPDRNHNTVSRPELMGQIDKALKHKNKVVLSGSRQSGKSSAVVDYLCEHVDDYQHVFFFAASNEVELQETFRKLAKNMALVTEDEPANAEGLLRQWFESNPGCLLIFDDALENKVIEKFLPRIKAKIIVTSVCTQWPSAFTEIKVTAFSCHTFDVSHNLWWKELNKIRESSVFAMTILKALSARGGKCLEGQLEQDATLLKNNPDQERFCEVLPLFLFRYSLVSTEGSSKLIMMDPLLHKNFEVIETLPLPVVVAKSVTAQHNPESEHHVASTVQTTVSDDSIFAESFGGNAEVVDCKAQKSISVFASKVAPPKPPSFKEIPPTVPGLRFPFGGKPAQAQVINGDADYVDATVVVPTPEISLYIMDDTAKDNGSNTLCKK